MAGKDKRTNGGPNKRAGETGSNVHGNRNQEFTPKRRDEFCVELALTGRMIEASRKVGVSRVTVTKYLKRPAFAAQVAEAMEEFRESLVKEAQRRAMHGTLKPVFFQGVRAKDTDADGNVINAAIREYDTPLLILLLKRYIPEFRDKSTVENRNVNVDMGMKDMESMTPEQRAKLRELIDMEDEPDEPAE